MLENQFVSIYFLQREFTLHSHSYK